MSSKTSDRIAPVKYRHVLASAWCASTIVPLMAQSAGVGSIRRLSPDLDRIVPPGAVIEKVAGNLQFAEGPVWLRSGGVAGEFVVEPPTLVPLGFD